MTRTVNSVCSYCGTGCGIRLETDGQRIVSLIGDAKHPTNRGKLCSKGRELHHTVRSDDRLLRPQLRTSLKAPFAPVDWDTALDYAADKFARIIREHGPDAVAFYVSGQLLTEDYYVFNKLMKGFIGSNNIDTNSRLCMSSAVVGYKRAFGADGPPTCYDDIELAESYFMIGANPAYAHPIVFRRMEAAKEANPDLKIVVADPRRTDSCSIADLYLPLKPGTDVPLLQAMLNVTIKDIGIVGVEGGWEISTGGNGGVHVVATELLCLVETAEEVEEICKAYLQHYRETGRHNERCAPWQQRVGLEGIKAVVVDDVENRKALMARLQVYLDTQDQDPWAARVEDADQEKAKTFSEYKPIDIPVRVEV